MAKAELLGNPFTESAIEGLNPNATRNPAPAQGATFAPLGMPFTESALEPAVQPLTNGKKRRSKR